MTETPEVQSKGAEQYKEELFNLMDEYMSLSEEEYKILLTDQEGLKIFDKKGALRNMRNIYKIDGLMKRQLDRKKIEYKLL